MEMSGEDDGYWGSGGKGGGGDKDKFSLHSNAKEGKAAESRTVCAEISSQ